jgi:hypothetical protein
LKQRAFLTYEWGVSQLAPKPEQKRTLQDAT